MAKQKSLLKFTGDLDGIGFYESNGKYYARKSNPVSGKRIQNDPAFVRTRENMSEFSSTAQSGKLLRDAVRPLLVSVNDKSASRRLHHALSAVKNLDLISARGQRTVNGGIAGAPGKVLLEAFHFNDAAHLNRVLHKQYQANVLTGEISIPGVKPDEDLVFPQGATHVSFTGGWARVDFLTGETELFLTNVVNLPASGSSSNVLLTPTGQPGITGTDFFLLLVSFYQEVNGSQYMLKNGSHNALGIVEIV